jgi:parallel beta-helix repeat protein
MNRKYLLSSIVIATLMIVTSFSMIASIGSPMEQPQKAIISAYTIRAQISIMSNGDFTNASGVVWGNGTATDPYIIEGWDINNGGGLGIYIYGATVFFIIRNCYLHGSGGGDGICLSYSSNAKVINNTCFNTFSGMWLETMTGCEVYNNTLLNNKDGIGIYGQCSISIHNNNFSNNINDGINIWSYSYGSSSNTIWNNTFYHNHGAGDTYNPAQIQAIDNEDGNKWNSLKGYGNYWSDWKAPDVNANGIIDMSYSISGSAGAKDNFPRAHATCTITSPTNASTYFTNWGWMKLMGVAYDDVMLSNVTWTNSLGGSGIAYGTTSWQSRGNVQLFAGVNVITVTAHAYDGHTATDVLTVTYDNVAPACTITSPTSNPTYVTNSATINLAGSASDANGIATVVWKNKGTGASGTAAGTTGWSITGIALNLGMNLIYVNATDNAGNKGSDAIWVTRSIDTLAVTITDPTSNPTMTAGWHMILLKGTATDDNKVTSVTWTNSLGGSGNTYMVPQSGGASVTWQSRGNVNLYSGDNVITVTAYDNAGNSKTDVLTVTYTGL